ncbi:glucose-6-phosphate isomerase [Papillibacter cinnamivorans]|uniref:Glucose-6-phosphate isomerase n=1 Tax=Papillibacter cinnamivorans DSM 12816 TaxID=1122930 RepID=A0A1W2A1C4_9FIRM|nr:glucose-6-phosphate isomerase [Papillibacter cinnamivorans]SMC54487.1 glucose-6-phosphate isomerase [Papillibacter cinnamivorans DSM 12816]
MIKADLSGGMSFFPKGGLEALAPQLQTAHRALLEGTGAGAEYTGWVELPRRYDREEFSRIQRAAEDIRTHSDALVVIGIGGSYLGARAALELLRSPYYNLKKKDTPDVFFAGNTLSGDALGDILELLGDRDFSVNVISKSGTTLEPAVAFRTFKDLLERKYGREGAKRRIFATTDKSRGALRTLAQENGYTCFSVPDDIGGRYSVLTAVGLLPMAASGISTGMVMAGAEEAMEALAAQNMENPAWLYAAGRNLLYGQGKRIEVLAYFEPAFRFMGEWWKQLFGESEGKGGRGIFPASVEYTADLHSMGQYIQDGERGLFETMVRFLKPRKDLSVAPEATNADGLDFLTGRGLQEIQEQARLGTKIAHADGGVPNLLLTAEEISERTFGQLVYFFELSCGLSGYLLGVNPFDQPGVEAYKRNMMALMGKPGTERERAEINARIASQGGGGL